MVLFDYLTNHTKIIPAGGGQYYARIMCFYGLNGNETEKEWAKEQKKQIQSKNRIRPSI